MKLFLASEGSDPQTIEKLKDYLGGFNGQKVAYIPTAKNGNGEGRWENSDSWQFLLKSGMKPTCIELENYHHGMNPNIFMDKEVLWFTGGSCSYLMYWIRRTNLDLFLPDILEKTLFVGSSAGAMITGPDLSVAEWYIDDGESRASEMLSLNLVDFHFYPHYNESLKPLIEQNYTGKKMYLVKNGEVVLVEDDKIKVLGEERIITNE